MFGTKGVSNIELMSAKNTIKDVADKEYKYGVKRIF